MTARRNFLKGAGIVSAFVVGAASYKQVKEIANKNKDISHLSPPSDATTLQINGSYGELPKPVAPVNSWGESFYSLAPINRVVTNSVAMAVGKDNKLWIKDGDQWRRVVLEG